jgi:short-subunit dehydrogenase
MNRKELSGKVAIVTGASSGIGRATAILLANEGVHVALVSRSKEKLEDLSKELPGSLAVPADMTKIPQIRGMVKKTREHFGRIDILVNNAGQGYDAPVEKINITTFRYIYALHVAGPLVAMQQVIPVMRQQGGGTVVNISSGTALMNLPGMSAYASSKRALAAISLAAREELNDDAIGVSVVYPYITLSDFEKNTIRETPPEDGNGEEPAGPFPPDQAKYVAQKILDGIISGEAEIFAHEWMKNLGAKEQDERKGA